MLGQGPGGTNVPSQTTEYHDALLSTTLANYSPTLADNIFKENAVLAALREFGGVRHQNGGERVRLPLMYEKNSTVKSIDGYEIIDTTPQDGITTAFYEWRQVAGTISISYKEERQNSGEHQIIDLLQAKIEQAENSMREELNRMILTGTVSGATFVPGNDLKDLNPLGYFLRKDNTVDPTTGGNVGNISGASESWWRHNTAVADSNTKDTGNAFALNVSTWKGLQTALKRMYNFCGRGGGGAPNLIIADQITYEQYESGLDDKVRFQNLRMADLGFDSVKVKGAEFIWDEIVPDVNNGTDADNLTAGTAFFLNTKHYKLTIDSETDIITTPFVAPENQAAKTAKIMFMGNVGSNNLRKLGVLYGISQSINS